MHNSSAPSEYRNQGSDYSRTYLTLGLSTLLIGAAKRLSGTRRQSVVEVADNFGGGKTLDAGALPHGGQHAGQKICRGSTNFVARRVDRAGQR